MTNEDRITKARAIQIEGLSAARKALDAYAAELIAATEASPRNWGCLGDLGHLTNLINEAAQNTAEFRATDEKFGPVRES